MDTLPTCPAPEDPALTAPSDKLQELLAQTQANLERLNTILARPIESEKTKALVRAYLNKVEIM